MNTELTLQKLAISLIAGVTLLLLIAIIPIYLGTDFNGTAHNIFGTLPTKVACFAILICIIKTITSKSVIESIVLISLVYSLFFTVFITSGFKVLELSDHTDFIGPDYSSPALTSFSFDEIEPVSPNFKTIYEPPFTIIHTEKSESYKKDLEHKPDWIGYDTSGYPLLWMYQGRGYNDNPNINILNFLTNIAFYYILFFLPNFFIAKITSPSKP